MKKYNLSESLNNIYNIYAKDLVEEKVPSLSDIIDEDYIEEKEEKSSLLDESIRKWYEYAFPSDDIYDNYDESSYDITFNDMLEGMKNGQDAYDFIPGDSIVRERVFDRLSKILDIPYNDVYDMWIRESENKEQKYRVMFFKDEDDIDSFKADSKFKVDDINDNVFYVTGSAEDLARVTDQSVDDLLGAIGKKMSRVHMVNEDRQVKDVLDVELEDDDTVEGGTSFRGEKVRDFIDDCDISQDADIDELNKSLKDCGIKELKERNLTKAERHNRDMERIFNNQNKNIELEKEFLLANGVSSEEVNELANNTGLHGDALRQKIIDKGLDKKFRIYAFGVNHQNKINQERMSEDTVKQNGKWVNKGKEGTHGKFATKKAADKQRKAMFANGFKGESIEDGSLVTEDKTVYSLRDEEGNNLGEFSKRKHALDKAKEIKPKYVEKEIIDDKTGECVSSRKIKGRYPKLEKLIKEGAEGKRVKDKEYVIYNSESPNKIVAKRSTRVEAEYASRKLNREKDLDTTYDEVPKGRFKVGDSFEGPFDDNWNLTESKKKEVFNNYWTSSLTEDFAEFKVIDKDGNEIVKGDKITDFRGDKAIFDSISKIPGGGSTGKILAVEGNWRQEYYPQVFDLKIVEREAEDNLNEDGYRYNTQFDYEPDDELEYVFWDNFNSDKKDVEQAKRYGLTFEYDTIDGPVWSGRWEDLDDFCNDYLGYEFHPDFLFPKGECDIVTIEDLSDEDLKDYWTDTVVKAQDDDYEEVLNRIGKEMDKRGLVPDEEPLEEDKIASFKDGDEVHEIHKYKDDLYVNKYGNKDGHSEQGEARFNNRKDALKAMHKHRPQAVKVKEDMSPEERQAFIDKYWVKVNELGKVYPTADDIADCYEVNALTKKYRNVNSGRDTHKVDDGSPMGSGRVTMQRKNGKNQDLSVQKIINAINKLDLLRG